MKIKDIALSAAAIGERVVKAIAIGAVEVWSAVKYIIFKDPVVAQICATNWGDGTGLSEEDAAKVTSLGDVFRSNTEITSFDELAEFTSLTNIGAFAFSDCSNLKSVKLPNGLKTISQRAFRYCPLLEGIKIVEGVEEIGEAAFYGSGNLHTVVFPSSLITVGSGAFNGKVNISKIFIHSVEHWLSIKFADVVSVPTGGTNELYIDKQLVQDIIIPNYITELRDGIFRNNKSIRSIQFHDNVTKIGDYALENCISINEITLPNNLQEIGAYAFAGTSIESVDIPNSVTVISNRAFRYCSQLKEVHLPEGLERVEAATFYGDSSIANFTIPQNVSFIGETAFYNCPTENLICLPVSPPSLGGGNFTSSRTIYVPDQSVEAYKTASNWSTYASRIKPLSEYVES